MHEAAVGPIPGGEPDVGGVAGGVLRCDSDDVSVSQARLDPGDAGAGNIGHGQGRHVSLDFGDAGDKALVAF